ncbi:uncharacterized protein L969DRAFT_87907 [Mixia osmundae IAM 14324]|uniref:uncharacterized protein n=1 Tax=Mixia osmundae (strain CBS 9802 / IAM 14324 / JCM 22182 / KY 12970) TaxID=764103 RepID=UPI0004A54D3E|nr:uncharacterized protein L969DRAFT_87907 [Mixia osmundae IAM 14324]KEI38678.1 hypothetical protein L969DRAFT_87907 [Mixia osmundae IAM 14324]
MHARSLLALLSGSLVLASRLATFKQPYDDLKQQAVAAAKYPAQAMKVPVDHFDKSNKDMFELRYWVSLEYFKTNGPVVILLAGETDAEGLTFAFDAPHLGGRIASRIGAALVVVEHRFYGQSHVTADLSTDSLRFLTTAQASADYEYFSRRFNFAGHDLSAPKSFHMITGASYAGGIAARCRKLYPGVFPAAIASSALLEAQLDLWSYYEAPRKYGPPQCIRNVQVSIYVIDQLLKHSVEMSRAIKDAFHVKGEAHNDDLSFWLAIGLQTYREKNWYTKHTSFDAFCSNMTATMRHSAADKVTMARLVEQSGFMTSKWHEHETIDKVTEVMLNYVVWQDAVQRAYGCNGLAFDACWNFHDSHVDLTYANTGRLWLSQVCKEVGLFQTGSAPVSQLSLVSRAYSVASELEVCRLNFPRGDRFEFPAKPEVKAWNAVTDGWNIDLPWLAHFVGEKDMWRVIGPAAPGAPPRKSTPEKPFYIIEGGYHGSDVIGLDPSFGDIEVPRAILAAQEIQNEFAEAAYAAWRARKA